MNDDPERFLAIGVDPKEKDGTVTFVMGLGADRLISDMSWREAAYVSIGLQTIIREAAHKAGVSDEILLAFYDEACAKAQRGEAYDS